MKEDQFVPYLLFLHLRKCDLTDIHKTSIIVTRRFLIRIIIQCWLLWFPTYFYLDVLLLQYNSFFTGFYFLYFLHTNTKRHHQDFICGLSLCSIFNCLFREPLLTDRIISCSLSALDYFLVKPKIWVIQPSNLNLVTQFTKNKIFLGILGGNLLFSCQSLPDRTSIEPFLIWFVHENIVYRVTIYLTGMAFIEMVCYKTRKRWVK